MDDEVPDPGYENYLEIIRQEQTDDSRDTQEE
jgi:hypothetical protein